MDERGLDTSEVLAVPRELSVPVVRCAFLATPSSTPGEEYEWDNL